MGRKWLPEEEKAIEEVRKRLHTELTSCPQFPEVVGDRRILRFLKGKQMNVDEATHLIKDFLHWRKENKVDDIRQDIVYGGRNTPFKFPKGKQILKLAPQIVISPHSVDKKGRPLAMELFNFNPKDVFKAIKLEEFLLWLTYALEFRVLVMEQMAHEYEQKYLKEHPDPATQKDGWGVVLLDFTIRDLKGVGMAHASSDGRAIVGAALKLGYNNYSEYLGKSIMVNVPWVFNSMWFFVKSLLDASTLAKIQMCGSDYMEQLLKEMTIENVPAVLGGDFQLYNEPIEFDVSSTSTLYYPGCEDDAAPYILKRREFEKHDPEEYCYYWNGITPPDSIYGGGNVNDSTKTNASVNVGKIEDSVKVSNEEKKPANDQEKKAYEKAKPQLFIQTSEEKPTITEPVAKHHESIPTEHALKNHSSSEVPRKLSSAHRDDRKDEVRAASPKNAVTQLTDDVKGFLLFCYKENPILSLIGLFLILFVLRYHPHVLKSIVPSILGTIIFAYFASIQF